MGKINKLDDRIINQIAAGEVVENPASVVKELVENAIDAGSTSITVEFSKGGTEYIRIIDNGSGMEEDDAQTAFIRHATSKISNSDDLQHIATMGFRGEALASISEVSEVELTTSTGDIGTQILVRGGVMESIKKIGFQRGTTIEVRNLFYNTPARKKFLKSLRQETGNILELCSKLILAHPGISFKVINSSKTELSSSSTDDALDAICAIYGESVREEVVLVSHAVGNIEITGYVSKPAFSQLNRRKQIFFINGRYVKSPMITAALEDAYKERLMINKYPFAVLYINLPYNEVDVNVHPQKTEVRFENSKAVFSAVGESVNRAINSTTVFPEFKFEKRSDDTAIEIKKAPEVNISLTEKFSSFEEKSAQVRTEMPEPVIERTFIDTKPKTQENLSSQSAHIQEKKASLPKVEQKSAHSLRESLPEFKLMKDAVGEAQPFIEKEKNLQPAEQIKIDVPQAESKIIDFTVCGTLWDTYIIVQSGDTSYIIDQHAAHERLLYDKYYESFKAKKVYIQQLLIPEVIEVSSELIDVISENTEKFAELGFDVEIFGNSSCLIRGVPSLVMNAPFKLVFEEIVDKVKNNASGNDVIDDVVCTELIKSACKHAIKGNQKLSQSEISFILNAVTSMKSFTCPHGRPIAVTMTKKDVEKRFGRIQ